MANPITQIIITAVDRTKAAFGSVKGGLASIGNSAAGLRSLIGGLFVGISVAKFVGTIKQAADEMDNAVKSAQAAGTSVENFSALTYAAGQSGAGVDVLQKSLVNLSVNLDDAKNGTGEAVAAFKELNIDPAQFTDSSDALLVIAERFAAMPDGINKTTLAADLFGKKIGPQLIPFLNQGRAGIEALKDEAAALGVVLDTETSKAAEEFNDNLDKLRNAGKGLGNNLAREVLPGLVQITDAMAQAAKDSGLLMAGLVALGGLGAALFTDDLLTNTQKLAKAQAELAKATEGARKAGIDDTGYIERKREEVRVLQEQVDAEKKAREAEAATATAARTRAAEEEKQAAAREENVKAQNEAAKEQINDAKLLQSALQSAFSASLQAEKDYLRQAKKLRAEANGTGAAGDDPEAQAAARLNAVTAAMKLNRTAGTDSLENTQDQAEALRALADQLDDVALKTEYRRQANLAEAAALEKAAAEEKQRAMELGEQYDENQKRADAAKANLEGADSRQSVEIKTSPATAKTIEDLEKIKHLIEFIKQAGPIATTASVPGASASAADLAKAALQYGRRQ
jgi:DNA repair exonuclease SbcCD ATPase subunit